MAALQYHYLTAYPRYDFFQKTEKKKKKTEYRVFLIDWNKKSLEIPAFSSFKTLIFLAFLPLCISNEARVGIITTIQQHFCIHLFTILAGSQLNFFKQECIVVKDIPSTLALPMDQHLETGSIITLLTTPHQTLVPTQTLDGPTTHQLVIVFLFILTIQYKTKKKVHSDKENTKMMIMIIIINASVSRFNNICIASKICTLKPLGGNTSIMRQNFLSMSGAEPS